VSWNSAFNPAFRGNQKKQTNQHKERTKLMKTIKNLPFAAVTASALTLLFQTSPARADNSAPVRLTFEKTLAGTGPAPYLFHFTGTFGGDFTGQLYVGMLVREFIDAEHQLVHIVADYVFTADDGIHSFTARVEGNSNFHTGDAVLNGVVTVGWLEGAQVQEHFEALGGGHFQGTFRIMPASAG
jgi:hypothetical protein